jgi:tellurite resistance protein TehA-like permease
MNDTLIMAILLIIAYKRRGELPFSLTWRVFTFPLGAIGAARGTLFASPAPKTAP